MSLDRMESLCRAASMPQIGGGMEEEEATTHGVGAGAEEEEEVVMATEAATKVVTVRLARERALPHTVVADHTINVVSEGVSVEATEASVVATEVAHQGQSRMKTMEKCLRVEPVATWAVEVAADPGTTGASTGPGVTTWKADTEVEEAVVMVTVAAEAVVVAVAAEVVLTERTRMEISARRRSRSLLEETFPLHQQPPRRAHPLTARHQSRQQITTSHTIL